MGKGYKVDGIEELLTEAKCIWRKRINPISYETWFESLKIVSFDEEEKKVVLLARNEAAEHLLKKRYGELICETLSQLSGEKISVEWREFL